MTTKWDIGRYAIDRVGPYEASFDRPERLAGLLAVHDERLEPWCRHLELRLERDADGLLAFQELKPSTLRVRWFLVFGVGLGLVVVIGWLLYGAISPTVAIVAGILLAIGMMNLRKGLKRFKIEALVHRMCVSCRYDLSACSPAIDPAQFGSWNVGPRRCPECGALWPLVPGAYDG